MKSITIKIYFIILLLISTTAVFAQTAKPLAKVTGSLQDDKAKPMDYATVSLLNTKDSSTVKGTLSNEAGVYTFDHINPGSYIIKATVVGYQKAASKPFVVADGSGSITVPVLTLQQGSQTLNTVTVTSSKPLIEHKVDRTVMNVENSVLAAGNSAMEILQRAPGVTVDKDDNISLKGKQGVTVMINDKLTYLTSAQLATLLRSTDGTTIQSIEIITNPSAKYDAAGNSGIINIKLKKNKQSGTNGSITAGVGYGHYGRDNETISLNHKEGNLNIFGSFSHSDNKRYGDIALKRIIDSAGKNTYFNQYTTMPQANHNNSYRLGADYDLSSKNTIGFVVNGYFNNETDYNNNNTNIGPSFTQVDSSLQTVSTIQQTYHSIAVNLNDTYKLDTAGQELSADLDYSKFKNNSNSQYLTNFFFVNPTQNEAPQFLGDITPSDIDIRTGKVDYTKPLTKSLKFESGLKFSDVKTDNNLMETTISPTNPYLSTNHFIYDEKIDAGYVNFSQDYKNTSVQAGLRAEYTSSTANGDSSNVVQNIPRHYFDLFPSVFVDHTFNDKNELGISYSRRIDRPQYDNLNPFVYHLDPYTYQKGNPFLKPQYTNNFELNYTYNKNLTVTLGYSKTTDVITQIPGTDPVTKVSFVTNENLQVQNSYNINVYSPYTITKWWTGDVNATGFYLGFKSNGLEGGNLNNGQVAYQLRTTQTFLPFAGYKAEVTADYQSSLVYGLFDVKPQYGVDAGVSHSFAHKKANVKFSVSDIFNTRTNDVSSNYQNNNLVILQKRDTRIARLTLTYNFGNNKIKARHHQTGADDEKGRVKGAN